MQDRVPVNPGRVLVTPENGGAAYYATLTRADNPTQEGTPLNKANLLTDATAALFGLGANAAPNDVLAAAWTLIDKNATDIANGVKIATGSYTGTGTYGSSNPCSLTFSFAPKILLLNVQDYTYTMGNDDCLLITPLTKDIAPGGTSTTYRCPVTWSNGGKTISWYNTASASNQLNVSDTTYHYIIIG